MRAKTLLKNLAQSGRPLAEAVTQANDALCEGNAASMFVTAWIGELDLSNGHVRFVNAGHNPPVRLCARDGSASFLSSIPGLVLGTLSGVPYRTGEIALEPGDALYLYTDGITEQADSHGELRRRDPRPCRGPCGRHGAVRRPDPASAPLARPCRRGPVTSPRSRV